MTPERRAYRQWVRDHHPDRGGDPEEFAAGLLRWHARLAATGHDDLQFHRTGWRRTVLGLSRSVRHQVLRAAKSAGGSRPSEPPHRRVQ